VCYFLIVAPMIELQHLKTEQIKFVRRRGRAARATERFAALPDARR